MPRGFAPALSRPSSSRATAVTRPSVHGPETSTSWPRRAQVGDDVVAEALLDRDRAAREAAGIEGRDQVVHVELGRVDRLLQVQAESDVADEDVQRPLLLLVAAGRSPGEIGLAVAEGEPRAERRARAGARPERGGEALLEPEHLRARAERPAERGDHGRALQPAAARGRREHVPPAVDDVEVDGVAARRLPRSRRHRGLDEVRQAADARAGTRRTRPRRRARAARRCTPSRAASRAAPRRRRRARRGRRRRAWRTR